MFDKINEKLVERRNRNNQVIKELTNKNIIMLLIILITALIILIIYGLNKFNYGYKNIKTKPSEQLVYTYYENKKLKQEIPILNLKNPIFEKVNKDILLFTSENKDNKNSVISYDYTVNGIVLSLIVKIGYNNKGVLNTYFRTYNINLEKETVISNKALIEYYETSEEEIENKIIKQFKKYYYDEVKKGIIPPQECSFERYLKLRHFDKIKKEEYSYYIDKGDLKVYIPFNPSSYYGEQDYFKEKDFEFFLKKAPIEK